MPERIYKSPDASPPLPEISMYEYLLPFDASRSPRPQYDKSLPAFIDGLTGRTVTRGQVEDSSLRLVTALREMGLKRGDTVCIWGLNSIEWEVAAFGVMAAGLTASPANAAYSPHEVAYQMNDSGSIAIFVDPALVSSFEKAQAELMEEIPLQRIILLCQDGAKPLGTIYQCIEELCDPDEHERGEFERFDGPDAQTTAWMCYSSGTTGLPKGVETTHHNLTSQVQAVNASWKRLESGRDVVLGVLPLSHMFGLCVVTFQSFSQGVPVVLLPRFEEIRLLQAIEKYKITYGLIVPPIIIVLVHSPNLDKYDISSLKRLLAGAAPLSKEVIKAFNKRLPTVELLQGYGLTETTPAVLMDVKNRPGWVGKLIATWEARIVDEEGQDMPDGERGELWVRGPSTMKGYHNKPEATANTFAGRWLKTGDVVVRDPADGWFKIVDRIKELIKYKGFQVPPAELEALLLTHPKVLDAGVIGVFDESQATELPRAYIVVKPDSGEKKVVEKEVQDWVACKVANHKRLRGGVEVIEVIPKSPSGKILRKDLRVRAENERGTKGAKL